MSTEELVFFSSRSGHMKTKKVKQPTISNSETPNRRISTIASLRAVKNVALPNSKAHLPSSSIDLTTETTSRPDSRQKSSSHEKSSIWSSFSTSIPTMPSSIRQNVIEEELPSSSGGKSNITSNSNGNSKSTTNRSSMESRISHRSNTTNATTTSNTSNSSISDTYTSTRESRFWDDMKIENTVNGQFIEDQLKRIPGTEILVGKLNQPVAFGAGLTETTYSEWIISRAQKFFLILVDLGIPDQIFGVTDESWADDDLPVPYNVVPRLKLSKSPDPALDRRFYRAQYNYLLRFLYSGVHIDFEEFETVPLDVIASNHNPFHQAVDEVQCPKNPNITFTRKKFNLTDRSGNSLLDSFMTEVDALRTIPHQHIVDLHASYTYKGWGYLLFTPATDFTLRNFLSHPPTEFTRLTEDSRRFKLLDWMRCLSDALAYLYDKEIPHGDIRPRSIVIDGKSGEIYFSDVGSHRRLSSDSKVFKPIENERYEYSAPELFQRVAHFNISQAPTNLLFDGGRTGRRVSVSNGREAGEGRRMSVATTQNGPDVPVNPNIVSLVASNTGNTGGIGRRDSNASTRSRSTISSTSSSESSDSPYPRAFTTSTKGVSSGPVRVGEWISKPASKSDVFSLGCIMLDMLTFHSKKKKLSNFANARARHNRAAGSRGGGQPDSSFHANLNEVNDWIKDLKKEAMKRNDDAVSAVLTLIARMILKDPKERPTPRQVGDTLYSIMQIVKRPHCEQFVEWSIRDSGNFSNWSGWDDHHDYSVNGDEVLNMDAGDDIDELQDRFSTMGVYTQSYREQDSRGPSRDGGSSIGSGFGGFGSTYRQNDFGQSSTRGTYSTVDGFVI